MPFTTMVSLMHAIQSKNRNSSAFSSAESSPAPQLAGTGELASAALAPTCTSVTTDFAQYEGAPVAGFVPPTGVPNDMYSTFPPEPAEPVAEASLSAKTQRFVSGATPVMVAFTSDGASGIVPSAARAPVP